MAQALPVIRVVGAAIVQGRTCLVAQRSAKMSTPLKWEFPGGKPEPGEEARAALIREIREELEIEIEVGEWLGRGASESGGRRIELDVFVATWTGGQIRLAEHCRHGWFEESQIDGLDWAEADRPVLEALKTHLADRRSSRRRSSVSG